MMLKIAAAQTDDGGVAASFADTLPATHAVASSSSTLPQGAPKGVLASDVHQRNLQAFESSDYCMDSPLWKKEVDSAKYIFGCEEIEVCIHKYEYDTTQWRTALYKPYACL